MDRKVFGFILLIAVLLTTGCGTNGWDIQYRPNLYDTPYFSFHEGEERFSDQTITVFDFLDDRINQTHVGVEYKKLNRAPQRFVASRPIGKTVTEAIATTLESMGYTVVRSSGWNLNPSDLKDLTTDLALGGKIKVFYAEKQPAGVNTYILGHSGINTYATVNLRVVVADPSMKKVLWEGDLIGTEVYQSVSTFGIGSPETKYMLEKAFAKAVIQLAEDPSLREVWRKAKRLDERKGLTLLEVRF